jgi:hypothetical protein
MILSSISFERYGWNHYRKIYGNKDPNAPMHCSDIIQHSDHHVETLYTSEYTERTELLCGEVMKTETAEPSSSNDRVHVSKIYRAIFE